MKRYGKLEAPLGRHVIIGDLVDVHPGKPERCICRGSGEVTLFIDGERQLKECGAALNAFRKLCGFRTIDTPQGPRWRLGMSPEEWGFQMIFQAEMRAFEMRQRLDRLLARSP